MSSRCTGNFAAFIWWLTERVARSVLSARSICSISQRDRSRSALFCSIRSAHVAAMPCSVQTQRIQFGNDITHGRPPAGRAGGRSAWRHWRVSTCSIVATNYESPLGRSEPFAERGA